MTFESFTITNPFLQQAKCGPKEEREWAVIAPTSPTTWYACSSPSPTLQGHYIQSSTNGLLRRPSANEPPEIALTDLQIINIISNIDGISCDTCKFNYLLPSDSICAGCLNSERSHAFHVPKDEPIPKEILQGDQILPVERSDLIL